MLALDERGSREQKLLQALVKKYSYVAKAADKVGIRTNASREEIPGLRLQLNVRISAIPADEAHPRVRILSDPSKLNGAPVVASVLHEDRSGLFVGDIISELDGVTVKNSAEAAKSVEAALNGWRSGKKQRTLKKATRREFKLKIIRVEESFRRSLQSESLACVASPSKLTVDVDSAILIELLLVERRLWNLWQDQSLHSSRSEWRWLHGSGETTWNWPSLRHEWIMDVTSLRDSLLTPQGLSRNLKHLKRIKSFIRRLEQAFVEPLPHVNFFGESMASEIDVEFDKLLAQHDLSFAGHICATTGRFHQDGRPVLNISAFADTLPSRSDWQENLIECFNMKHLFGSRPLDLA